MWFVVPLLIVAIEAELRGSDRMGLITGFLTVPLLTLWILLAFVCAIWSALCLRRRRWRRAALAALLPAALIFGNLNIISTLGYVGDAVYFASVKSEYDIAIAKLPPNPPRLKAFGWGGWTSMWTDLVYDETDQISLPLKLRPPRITSFDDMRDLVNVSPLWSHYYICDFAD